MSEEKPEFVDNEYVAQDFMSAVAMLESYIRELAAGNSPGGQMGCIVWTALKLAERTQYWAAQQLPSETTEVRAFFSMEGLLVDASGHIVTADGEHFPHIAAAFSEGADTP